MKLRACIVIGVVVLVGKIGWADVPYAIVDTGQEMCYGNRNEIKAPSEGKAFYGQDGNYAGNQPTYTVHKDGTVTDEVTGLMWTRGGGEKVTYPEAVAGAKACRVGGYEDWRLPSIKELYSLILFSGMDPDPMSRTTGGLKPFIDAEAFEFAYGDEQKGERIIDMQYATTAIYKSTTMGGNRTMFGVNFADGRIKGYPIGAMPGRGMKTFCVLYVRGNEAYGKNEFKDNGDGTVTDEATGLVWMKVDSGSLKAGAKKDGRLNWEEALAWAEGLEYAGKSDWRLPNAKELQSIVDYQRCPDVTNSAAIDPVFECTAITNEGGVKDWPCYWTGTSHCRGRGADAAVYVAFGRALGWMQFPGMWNPELMDVHGAGAQRSDPKSGDAGRFPYGRGPQGDVIRIYNYVRCVRGGTAEHVK